MPFPYTRQRKRNRAKTPALQPWSAPPASLVSAVHGTNKTTLTFNQAMDVSLTSVPPGLLVDGVAPSAVTWNSNVEAELTTATSSAADPYVLPANNTWRTIAGAPVAASTGVLT